MSIIKCMAEYTNEKAEKAGSYPAVITEDVFMEALINVLTNDYPKLVKRYGRSVVGFFCIIMDWE